MIFNTNPSSHEITLSFPEHPYFTKHASYDYQVAGVIVTYRLQGTPLTTYTKLAPLSPEEAKGVTLELDFHIKRLIQAKILTET